jgi:hypothetical protein
MPVPLLPYGSGSVSPPGLFPVIGVKAMFTSAGWTDITAYVRIGGGGQIQINRGSSRIESPVIRYEPGTMTVPLDNRDRRFDPTNLAGPYVSGGKTQVLPRVRVQVSAVYQSVTYYLFTGYADAWPVVYSLPRDASTTLTATDGFRVLSGQARAPHGSYAGGAEDSGARVTRILDDAGWPAASRNITPGDATLQPTLLGGTPVDGIPVAILAAGGATPLKVSNAQSTFTPLDELQLTADTEMGELYCDGRGFLVFRHRHALYFDTRSTTPQAVFGDAGAELRYADVTITYDDATLWNGATIANTGGTVQQASDAASQQHPPGGYGPRVFDSENLIADSDFQALGYAQYVVAASKNPELRFSDITILPQRDPANLFPQVLTREIGDRITVTRRPPGGGSAITRDVFIRGISHTITSKTWATTWVLQDATSLPPLLLLDGSMLLDGSHPYGF